MCSACAVLKLQETTAIGVAIQSGVTRWVPGRWQCAAGGEALARWAGQVEAPGHDAGAGLPLRTCCRQARRVCEPVILTLPLTPTPCKKTTLANNLIIGGQSHRNHPSLNKQLMGVLVNDSFYKVSLVWALAHTFHYSWPQPNKFHYLGPWGNEIYGGGVLWEGWK